jgi:5,10-methylene-tetrahydrofolate dehydrogenase/methenyl tetrahydrofolate cyclohydrolase
LDELNNEMGIDGIIVQLPLDTALPDQIDETHV